MTVVIADTSPINYLVLIGEAGILGQLYRRVVIPEAVLAELPGRQPFGGRRATPGFWRLTPFVRIPPVQVEKL